MRETIDLLKSTTGLDLGEFLQSAMDQQEQGSDRPQERSEPGSLDG